MAHLVLGYPSMAESMETARQYVEAGAAVLELQIPFSHPTADGPVITSACQQAVANGVRVEDCVRAIGAVKEAFPQQEIVPMSYANRLYAYDFQRFATEMAGIGIRHLIVPDWPFEQAQVFAPLRLVPVLAANTPPERVGDMLASGCDFFYLMSDFKITGGAFSLHPALSGLIAQIKGRSSPAPRIGIGFGISGPEQVRAVAGSADLAIIGSALIREQEAGRLSEYLASLREAFQTA